MAYKVTKNIKDCKGIEDLEVDDIWGQGINDNGCLLYGNLSYNEGIDRAIDYCSENPECGGFEDNFNDENPNICFRRDIDESLLKKGNSKCFEKGISCTLRNPYIRKKYSYDADLANILEREKYINCLWANFIVKENTYHAKLASDSNVDKILDDLKMDAKYIYRVIDEFLDLVIKYNYDRDKIKNEENDNEQNGDAKNCIYPIEWGTPPKDIPPKQGEVKFTVMPDPVPAIYSHCVGENDHNLAKWINAKLGLSAPTVTAPTPTPVLPTPTVTTPTVTTPTVTTPTVTSPNVEKNLKVYYTLDGTVRDTTNSYNGIANNIVYSQGIYTNSAALFKKSNSYISLPSKINPENQPFAVSLMLKTDKYQFKQPDQIPSNKDMYEMVVIEFDNGCGINFPWISSPQVEYGMEMSDMGKISAQYGNAEYKNSISNIALRPNIWYNILAIFTPGISSELYVNGVKQTGGKTKGYCETYNNTIGCARIRPNQGSIFYKGKISDVHIRSGVNLPTASDLLNIYNFYQEDWVKQMLINKQNDWVRSMFKNNQKNWARNVLQNEEDREEGFQNRYVNSDIFLKYKKILQDKYVENEGFQNELQDIKDLDIFNDKKNISKIDYTLNFYRFIMYFIILIIVSSLAITAVITNNFDILYYIFLVLIVIVIGYYIYDMKIR